MAAERTGTKDKILARRARLLSIALAGSAAFGVAACEENKDSSSSSRPRSKPKRTTSMPSAMICLSVAVPVDAALVKKPADADADQKPEDGGAATVAPPAKPSARPCLSVSNPTDPIIAPR